MRLNENITVNGNLSQIDNSPLYMINDLIFTSAGELVSDHFEECLGEIVPTQDYDAE